MERNKLQKQLGFVQLAETMIISLVPRKEADEKEELKDKTIGMGKEGVRDEKGEICMTQFSPLCTRAISRRGEGGIGRLYNILNFAVFVVVF